MLFVTYTCGLMVFIATEKELADQPTYNIFRKRLRLQDLDFISVNLSQTEKDE